MENEAPAPANRLKEHSGVAANLFSAVTGLVALVQAVRSDPLWIVLGLVALAALMAYQLWRRRWRTAGLAAVALLVLGVAGWALDQDRSDPAPAAATTTTPAGPTTATTTPAASTGAPDGSPAAGGAAAVFFSDVVRLDKKTGVDVDGGRPVRRYAQDATVDLYLDWGYILYSSARHSAMYDDTYAGPEEGAAGRCATYREARRTSAPHHYVGGGQQYCFTTSEGHPGWLQVVNQAGDGGALVKVTVWRE
ncbi:hypothetical protein NLX85_29415 [Micromonospora sp. A3M-1-15]|uniref:hypothetical protein n=1 Tax=Micromonospora sp. A3M-1-15 TaxID=2962035 RepID=UPI0020B88842|nr:hypothetical protein [Micromonospora sp. A3M-1-15]MCP3787491.1 hypothetical protein [Micromonospora sp. A3M-1-15]